MVARSVIVIVVIAVAARAYAQAPSEPPWATGVPAEKRQAAFVEYAAGNAAWAQSRYTEALAAYERALALWDNPQIAFNAAMSLIQLDRLLHAYARMERALAYGAEAFDTPELYQQAVLHKKLLRGQLVELTISVNERNATISVDGVPVPADTPTMMLAGIHQVVVSKPGFETETRNIVSRGGATERVEIELHVPVRELTRRWPVWIPWTVAGAGAGVATIGVVFHVLALRNYRTYEDKLLEVCPPGGCPSDDVPATVDRYRQRGDIQRVAAISGYVLGGAAIATGVVMLVMNRERLVEPRVTVTPTGDGVGVTLGGRF